MNFADLGLDQWVQKVCQKVNYNEPRQIQILTIPNFLQQKNTLISSETGTGKTAAFALPILQDLSKDPYGIFALVLTASRELALQISEQFALFGAPINLKVALLIGGEQIQKQIKQLNKIPHIIVATPGRCMDLLRFDETLLKYIKNIKYLVLDEVDRLMEQQVWIQIEEIRSHLQPNVFVHLVSATLNSLKQQQNGYKSLNECFPDINFTECVVNKSIKIPETISHRYILMPQLVKDFYLIYLLQQKIQDAPKIIFVPTCRKCQELSLLLNKLGIENVPLHSMLDHKLRISNLRRFRSRAIKTMVCTDVASRGLDLPDVKFVINWNLTQKNVDYIHRVGRVGRAGRRGTAITLLTQFDIERLLDLETDLNIKMQEIKFIEERVLEDMGGLSKLMKKIKIQMADDGTTEQLQKKQEERKQLKKLQKE